jgi:hypothetical protein
MTADGHPEAAQRAVEACVESGEVADATPATWS